MKNVMCVFPGQGSQSAGMGADWAANPVTKPLVALANEVLGYEVLGGDMATLTRTENAQPALLLAGVCAYTYLQSKGLGSPVAKIVGLAGHSVGEYTAAVASGALTLADGLKLVRARGLAMAQADAGGMLAVLGLDVAQCEDIATAEGVWVANVNSESQVILAGRPAELAAAGEAAKAAGAKRVLPLAVRGAFHTPLMRAAAEKVRAVLAEMPMCDPAVPVWSCAHATPATTAAALRGNLVDQITSPVRWHELMMAARAGMTAVLAEGDIDTVLELGAGSVLTNLVKRMPLLEGRAVLTLSLDSVDTIEAFFAEKV